MWAACLKFVAQTILLHLEVETGLEVEPEAVRRAEVAWKAQCRVGVIRLLPCRISLIRRGGTPMDTARRCWVMANGCRNSSRSPMCRWQAEPAAGASNPRQQRTYR